MNFLLRPIDYSTYAFYSSSLCRIYFPKLVKSALGLNLPLFLIGALFLMKAIASYIGDINLIEKNISFAKAAAFLLCLWIIPNSHLKLYQTILFIGLRLTPTACEKTPSLRKKIVQNLKYLFGQSFYFGTSLTIFFTNIIFFFFSFSTLLFFFAFIYPELMTIIIVNFSIVAAIVIFSFSFGLPCFLPVSIAFSGKNKNFMVETAHLGLANAKQVILLFFLEGLIKIISYVFSVFVIYIIRGISMDINTENTFDIIPDLMVKPLLQENFYFALTMILLGIFNIFWDSFKAIFLSLIYVHENKLYQPANSES